MRHFAGRMIIVAAGLGVVVFNLGCNHADEELSKRLLEENDKVLACQKELAQAKVQITALKRQVAEAVANPSHLQLTDPETIQLVASIRGAASNAPEGPTLDPKKASQIVLNGAPAMQACYERALKRNVALQSQSGIGLTLGITVRPNGEVREVDISPIVDKDMTACMRSAAGRWKFPSFTGSAVTIEQKLTLTPKT
jgi:hypothetical protein